jgi:hypothetical protein
MNKYSFKTYRDIIQYILASDDSYVSKDWLTSDIFEAEVETHFAYKNNVRKAVKRIEHFYKNRYLKNLFSNGNR